MYNVQCTMHIVHCSDSDKALIMTFNSLLTLSQSKVQSMEIGKNMKKLSKAKGGESKLKYAITLNIRGLTSDQ